ncbi:MAG TPA: hypothetical protein VGN33_11985 [Leifsonia sp.]|jgi:hypothetical protein|nr:hypothetical protein [Leifsonia sp.]
MTRNNDPPSAAQAGATISDPGGSANDAGGIGSDAGGIGSAASPKERRWWRASDWLDGKLFTVFGPPPLGPYGDEPAADPRDATCPLCGATMRDHMVEHDGHHTYLHCPGNEKQVEETGRG